LDVVADDVNADVVAVVKNVIVFVLLKTALERNKKTFKKFQTQFFVIC